MSGLSNDKGQSYSGMISRRGFLQLGGIGARQAFGRIVPLIFGDDPEECL
jgi:hypothetical protein